MRSQSTLSLVSQTTQTYETHLNTFVEPLPESVTCYQRMALIPELLGQLKTAATQIVDKLKAAKIAYARRTSLTRERYAGLDAKIQKIIDIYDTNKRILEIWLEEADRDVMAENPLINEDTQEILDPSVIEAGRVLTTEESNINPVNPNISGIMFTSSPRTSESNAPGFGLTTDGQPTRVLRVIPPTDSNPGHNDTILENETTNEYENFSPEDILRGYNITPFSRRSHPHYTDIKDMEKQIVELDRETRVTIFRREALPDDTDPLYAICSRDIERSAELIERYRQERDRLILNETSDPRQTQRTTPATVTSTTTSRLGAVPTGGLQTNPPPRRQIIRQELAQLTRMIEGLESAKTNTIQGSQDYVSLNQLIIEKKIKINSLTEEYRRLSNEDRNRPIPPINVVGTATNQQAPPAQIPRDPAPPGPGGRQTTPIVMTEDLIVRMGETIAQAMRPVLNDSIGNQTTTRPNKPVIQTVDKFNGELDKGLDWLEDFEVVSNNNNWDNEQKARSAIYALNGPAKDWFKGTWRDQHPHWHEFRTAFQEQYTPKGLQATLQNQLFSIQKRKDETYMDCYLRVRRLAGRAFPEASPSDLIIYMARAVTGDRHYTMIANQSNLDGLQMALRTIDTEVRLPFQTRPNQPFRARNKQSTITKPTTEKSKPEPTRKAPTEQPRSSKPFDFSKMKCANCDELGHSYRRCSHPANKQKIDRAMKAYADRRSNLASKQLLAPEESETDIDIIQDVLLLELQDDSAEESEDSESFEVDEDDETEEVQTIKTVRTTKQKQIKRHRVRTDKSYSPETHVRIGGRKVRALVDSGSHCTILDAKLCQYIKDEKYAYDGPRVKSVSGEEITPEFVYPNLAITIGKRTFSADTLISKNLSPPVILGIDAMLDGRFWPDIENKKIVLKKSQPTQSTTQPAEAVSNQTVPKTIETRVTKTKDKTTDPTRVQKTVHPFQTKFVQSAKDLVQSSSLRIKRITAEEDGPAWVTNRSVVKEEITLHDQPAGSGPTEVIRIEVPQSTRPRLSDGTLSQYEDSILQELEAEPEVSESFLTPKERALPDDHQTLRIKIDRKYMESFDYCKQLTAKEELILCRIFQRFRPIFAMEGDELGRVQVWEHRIETGNARPIRSHPYPVSEKEKATIREHVKTMLERGVIEPSVSAWSSPITLVPKRDDGPRFCVDYRKLNDVTVDDSYPIPSVDEALSILRGAKWFSIMDLDSCYWQIPMEEESKDKTTFICFMGSFAFNVMPFGLKNAPFSCMRTMDIVFGKYNRRICYIYMDDLLCHAVTLSEHMRRLVILFRQMEKYGLKLKTKKCHFIRKEVEYLGHTISAEGVQPDFGRVKAILEKPRPRTQKELKSFLGFISYYRRFIRDLARHASPLTSLLKKETPFTWGETQEQAHKYLIEKVTSKPILVHFDPAAKHELRVDASNQGLGAHLVQFDSEGQRHLLICASRTLRPNEKNFSVSDKECAAIIFGLKKFRPFVYGRKIDIITDHCGLKYLMTTKDLTNRLARWSVLLMDYEFDIIYNKGKNHSDADFLSRGPFPEEGTPPDEPGDEFDICQVTPTPFIDFSRWTTTDTKNAQQNDPYLQRIIQTLQNPLNDRIGFKRLRKKYLLDTGDLLLRRPSKEMPYARLCVPTLLVRRVLFEAHGSATVHFGQKKTLWRIYQSFHWTGLYTDVCNYVQTCDSCQTRKPPHFINRGLAGKITPGDDALQTISSDFITCLPPTKKGNVSILTAVDQITKYAFAIPLQNMKDTTVIEAWERNIIFKFGAPNVILTDQGPDFMSKRARQFFNEYGIEHKTTTPYHPQSNGECERFHRTLMTQLAIKTTDGQDWDRYVDRTVYEYNTTQHSVTGYAPLQLLTGFIPLMTAARGLGLKGIRKRPADVKKMRKGAIQNIQAYQRYNQGLVNTQRRPHNYSIGDLVLIELSQAKTARYSKLREHWGPPHKIVAIRSPQNILVQPVFGRKVKREVHVSHTKPYYSRGDFQLVMERTDPTTLELKTISIQGSTDTQSTDNTVYSNDRPNATPLGDQPFIPTITGYQLLNTRLRIARTLGNNRSRLSNLGQDKRIYGPLYPNLIKRVAKRYYTARRKVKFRRKL